MMVLLGVHDSQIALLASNTNFQNDTLAAGCTRRIRRFKFDRDASFAEAERVETSNSANNAKA